MHVKAPEVFTYSLQFPQNLIHCEYLMCLSSLCKRAPRISVGFSFLFGLVSLSFSLGYPFLPSFVFPLGPMGFPPFLFWVWQAILARSGDSSKILAILGREIGFSSDISELELLSGRLGEEDWSNNDALVYTSLQESYCDRPVINAGQVARCPDSWA